MKNGYLDRHEDVSGNSGTGKVAELAISSDGRVALFWPEPIPAVAIFPNLEAMIKAHGHNGKTSVVILNDEVEDVPHCNKCHVSTANGCCSRHDFGCPACLKDVG